MFFPIQIIPVTWTLLSLVKAESTVNRLTQENETTTGLMNKIIVVDKVMEKWAEKPVEFEGRIIDDNLEIERYNSFFTFRDKIISFLSSLKNLRMKSEKPNCDSSATVERYVDFAEKYVVKALKEGLNISTCFAIYSNISSMERSAAAPYITDCRGFQRIQNNAYIGAIEIEMESKRQELALVETKLRQCVAKLPSSVNPTNCTLDFQNAVNRAEKIEREIFKTFETTINTINLQLGSTYQLFGNCNVDDKLVSIDKDSDVTLQNMISCIDKMDQEQNFFKTEKTTIGPLKNIIEKWDEVMKLAKLNETLQLTIDKIPAEWWEKISKDSLKTDQAKRVFKSYDKIVLFKNSLDDLLLKSQYETSCNASVRLATNLQTVENHVVEALIRGLNISTCSAMFLNISTMERSAAAYITNCRRFQRMQNNGYIEAIRHKMETMRIDLMPSKLRILECVMIHINGTEYDRNPCEFQPLVDRAEEIESKIFETLEPTMNMINLQLGLPLLDDCNVEDELHSINAAATAASEKILSCIGGVMLNTLNCPWSG